MLAEHGSSLSGDDAYCVRFRHQAPQRPQGDDALASHAGRVLPFLEILFTDAGVMHSFLGEMDPGFVVCHDFDRIGDQNQASKIAQALAPDATTAEYLARSLVDSVKVRDSLGGEEPLPFESENVVVERLQRKLDALESMYCS